MDDNARVAENVVVYWNRYHEARNAGLTDDEARVFAFDNRDISELRFLVAKHADPRLIARIVL